MLHNHRNQTIFSIGFIIGFYSEVANILPVTANSAVSARDFAIVHRYFLLARFFEILLELLVLLR
jgi:hypothetical protein